MVFKYIPIFNVPQKHVYVIEYFGKYSRTLEAGIHVRIPLVEQIAYKYSLKERVLELDLEKAITKDNVMIKVDGVIYFQIKNSYKASYNVKNPIRALAFLAQTSMRSEIGKLELDRTF